MTNDSLLDNQELLFGILNAHYKMDLLPSKTTDIDKKTLDVIRYVDSMYQNNTISLEMALDIISSLIKGDYIRKNNSGDREIYLHKLQELFKLLEGKYRELIYQFNIGDLPKSEFLSDYKNLKSLSINTLAEMEEEEAILSH